MADKEGCSLVEGCNLVEVCNLVYKMDIGVGEEGDGK